MGQITASKMDYRADFLQEVFWLLSHECAPYYMEFMRHSRFFKLSEVMTSFPE